ncbi:hypothetical protein AVEN_12918-1 [Araneus ventricosus]|uniref:Uncharacterized protein n=1 Tax=Araneus ventricosus TaxID=182803 RepID=A0A4Y2IY45_ARAVE|nr:hypothetical protein AVEN_12918-1 [Araneus ventricosus]
MDSAVLYRPFIDPVSQVENAGRAGAQNFTFLFQAILGNLPKLYPKLLKYNIASKISNVKNIDHMQLPKQGKLLIITHNISTAKELGIIKAILGTPVSCIIRHEHISTRFLLRNISKDISLEEFGKEIEQ